MTNSQYERITAEEFRGRTATTTQSITNAAGTIPAGTLVTIIGKWKGLSIETRGCKQCGVKLRVSKVPPDDLDLLPR